MKLQKRKGGIMLCAAAITLLANQAAVAADVHIVKEGDTLWDISKKYGVTMQAIKQFNQKKQDSIRIGESLTIVNGETSNESIEQNKIEDSTGQVVYQVQKGDTLLAIAERYNTPVESLKQLNNTAERIYAGQHLLIHIGISEREKDLMARMVTAEAGGEPYTGKVAVAKVILNRVDAKGFPNTITDVIYEPIKYGYAFTPITDGRINRPATTEAKMAVDEALSTKGTNSDWLYFYNPKIATDKWITTRQTVAVIGNHVFAK
ncbi:peptigoglycan-binding protein LysM [Bacillus cereus]|uniref:cell wall hydrolase n=1 Tax=Bacillus cereus TaxID=1396 RepID=UPI000BFE1BD2|nr:cell wall hydrolase [Bacillus cereus]PGU00826.1 peptigoglycan-binding protein LysM [Bacillus cereus]